VSTLRLDRFLVNAGIGSRTEVSKLVRRGQVTVEGEIVTRPEVHIASTARVLVDGEAIEVVPLVLVYHKPVGILVTMDDPWGRATVATVLGPTLAAGMHPVGRLDADSSGLLLFSSDGTLTQRLLHPRRQVEKRYVAEVEGSPRVDLAEALAVGVQTEEGVHRARLLSADGSVVTLSVTEGKHRMVRRMLANLGLPVRTLHRTHLGEISLGDLGVGETRPPTPDELQWLLSLRGSAAPGAHDLS
jgi:23S rRNA pseudouridine2605 synthase